VKRWISLLGRTGTVITVVGLAMALVYFIPPMTTGYQSMGSWYMAPETFEIHESRVYSPQSGVRLNLTTNETLDMYVYEVSYLYISDWLRSYSPENWTRLSTFQDFKDQHTDLLIMHQQIPVGNSEVEYVPAKVENVTFIFVNPSQTETVELSWTVQGFQVIASKSRLLTAIEIALPVGLMLAAPWLFSYIKQKKKQPTL